MFKIGTRKQPLNLIIHNVRRGNGKVRSRNHVTFNAEIAQAYQPKVVENEEKDLNYFNPPIKSDNTFSLILPPPNITGTLHLGHALTVTVEDVIVRWKRMQGIETVWVPGFDHAGIATQVVVEKKLWKEKKLTRHDLGREKFVEEVIEWKKQKEGIIEQQLKNLGAALNWERKLFTMDPNHSAAVSDAFIRLFEKNLIYRGDQLVNWSCSLQSAISDIEVEHLDVEGPTAISVPGYEKPVEFGKLTHFAYKLHESDDEELVVATTRPETILGDVAVAVHPSDERYIRFIGRNLWHPFRKQTIPIICDSFVDPEFGTGAVKVTPAHDHNDFQAACRHNLATTLQVINESGHINNNFGKDFAGLPRFQAREVLVHRLSELGLLKAIYPHRMLVPICSRSKDIVELLVKPQWFVKCGQMAANATGAVRERCLNIQPEHFDKIWFNWLDNVRDWCISRQLWWGHRVPVYNCTKNDEMSMWIAAKNGEEARKKAATQWKCDNSDSIRVEQDEDVLDTWFSSALLPFSAHGWPDIKNDGRKKCYPLDLMETGHDILFFWIARMVMLGQELTGQLPFSNVLLHGIVCDAQGRKMSKSLGNVIAPEDVISGATLENLATTTKSNYETGILSSDELTLALRGQKKMFPNGIPECGADALRFTLCSHNIKGHFINFDVQECNANKLFCNKIWQATKFTNFWLKELSKHCAKIESIDKLTLMDRWILSRLAHMVDVCEKSMEKYDFHVATAAVKNFLYFEFCDIYLESTKRGLKMAHQTTLLPAVGHCWTLTRSLDTALRVVAPFMPRLAQHLHHRLGQFPNVPITLNFPKALDYSNYRDLELDKQVEKIMEVVVAIRRLKKMFNVSAKHQHRVYLIVAKDQPVLIMDFLQVVEDLTNCQSVNVIASLKHVDNRENSVSDRIGDTIDIHLTLPQDLINSIRILDDGKLDAKKSKLLKELEKINKMLSGNNYKAKATVEEQEIHAKKIATLEDKLARINYIQSLSRR